MKKDRFWTPSGKWDNRIAFHVKEVCEMLGLAQSTVYELFRDERIKVMKMGKHYLIRRAILEELLAEAEDAGRII